MLFPAIILFFLFLLLSAFFSSSETSFIAASPYKLDYLEKKGSRRAELVKRLLKKADNLLATILIGNTLVNAAAASIATFIFVSLIQNKNHAILFAPRFWHLRMPKHKVEALWENDDASSQCLILLLHPME